MTGTETPKPAPKPVPIPGHEPTSKPAPTATLRQVFSSRRVWVLAVLGFSSGLPLLLTASTLSAWMTNAGVDLKTIGIFTLVATPYVFKFAWAPLLDRYVPPLGWLGLGRRRSWMLVLQLAIGAALATMGLYNPTESPGALAALAVLVAFLSASQDIAADAYRTDVLPEEERALGAATFVMGYRVGLLVAGAVALILSDTMPWARVYLIMGLTMGIGVAATLVAPEPPGRGHPKTLGEAVVRPFLEYFRRNGAVLALAFLVLYKLGDAFANGMTTPFLLRELDFSNTEVGTLNKGFGMIAAIVGALAGGGLVAKLGIRPSLYLFGALQAMTNLLFVALAVVGKSYTLLVVAIGADNLTGGLGTSAFVAFLMSLCNRRYSATQYALLSSLGTLGGRVLAGASGYVVSAVGWAGFFGITVVMAVPALALLAVLPKDVVAPEEDVSGEGAT